MAEDLGVSDMQIKLLSGAINIYSPVGALLAGWTSDRLGRRLTIVLTNTFFLADGVLTMPESARWLAMKGRREGTRAVLNRTSDPRRGRAAAIGDRGGCIFHRRWCRQWRRVERGGHQGHGQGKLIKLDAVNQIKHEITVMRRLRHPNIVQLQEVMACKSHVFVVMEYVRGGPLYCHIPANGGFKEDDARRFFQQLVSALDFCHAQGMYRDIKPENLLVDEQGNLKVADFGLSAVADTARREAVLDTSCGTPLYVPPEVFMRRGYNGAKADAWSCGIVLFVLAAGRKPFRDDDFITLYRTISRGDYRCPRSFSPDLVRIIRRLLQPNPANRITLLQIMETNWFKKGFKEVSFYIDNKDCLRSLDGPEDPDMYDSDTDADTTVSSSSGSSSSVPGAAQADGGMHTSASAPSLVELEKMETAAAQPQQRMRRIKSLNAFDIIASSPSFDLSGLFEERGEQMRFVSGAAVPKIISKLEEIAGQVSFTARTKECQVSIEATRNGHKGALAISAKIFELTPELVMVQVCKKAGDTAEYRKFCHNELMPGLRGLVDGLPEEGLPLTLNAG